MPTRRAVLLTPLAFAAGAAAATRKMTLCLHQNTSNAVGFRKSLEGWSRAGIRNVEITSTLLDDFLKTDTLPGARRLLSDLNLTPVSASCGVTGLCEPNPNRPAALENFKRRCEMFASLGITKTYTSVAVNRKVTQEDYKAAPQNLRELGEIAQQFHMTAMAEFLRNSTFISTLTTLLKLIREASHPNLRPMLDCYHFWSGLSKFEDLDLLHPGELAHVHFQDVPDLHRELLDSATRAVPGEGIAPLHAILRKLAQKGYAGPLSVELFLPEFQQGDPFAVAQRIRQKAEPVMRKAGV
jgi:sugar phosphate isomerase/epimerase